MRLVWRMASILVIAGAGTSHAAVDCDNENTAIPPGTDGAFTVGTVIVDARTDLEWDPCMLGRSGADCSMGTSQALTWQGALQAVQARNGANHLGFNDWRLPNVKELQTLIERRCWSPAIDKGIFPGTDAQFHWTSTSVAADPANGWAVDFNESGVDAFSKATVFPVRLVRGGQPLDSFDGLGANGAPVAGDVTLSTQVGVSVNGQVTAVDPDGDPLTFSMLSGPAHGTVQLNADGSFTYTPDAGYSGVDTFMIEVADDQGASVVSTVTINVGLMNAAPSVPNYSYTTPEGVTVGGSVVGSDPDGDPLSYALGVAPTNGSAAVNASGTFTYTPVMGFVGIDSFTVQVSDGNGGQALSTITVSVVAAAGGNTPPVVPDFQFNTAVDTPLADAVTATDADGDTLAYSLLSAPANGSVTVNADGSFTYVPDAGFAGVDGFEIQVSDGKGGFAASVVTVTVGSAAAIPTLSVWAMAMLGILLSIIGIRRNR